ncbi:unnamed protein product [Mucor hiemalis]
MTTVETTREQYRDKLSSEQRYSNLVRASFNKNDQERTKRLCREYVAKVAFAEAEKLNEDYNGDSSSPYNDEGGISISENIIPDDRSNTSNNRNSTSRERSSTSIERSNTDDNVSPPNDDFWIHNSKNINIMFDQYQSLINELLINHKKLPIETYVTEFAALSHVFLLYTMNKITDAVVKKDLNWDQTFSNSTFVNLSTILTDLSLGLKNRQDCIIDIMMMSRNAEYCQNRVLQGIANLIQKIPTAAIKDSSVIGEAELWSTFFDPILSVLVADPEKSVQFRWSNTTTSESGNSRRPDAIISSVKQLEFGASLGFGEAKRYEKDCNRYGRCHDLLRLAIFTKNAIDINKLNGSLSFQIHGFNISFFLTRLDHRGIYTMVELGHMRFPESIEELPSFATLRNLKILLAINDAFWKLCQPSKEPELIIARYSKTPDFITDFIEDSQDKNRTCSIRLGE